LCFLRLRLERSHTSLCMLTHLCGWVGVHTQARDRFPERVDGLVTKLRDVAGASVGAAKVSAKRLDSAIDSR